MKRFFIPFLIVMGCEPKEPNDTGQTETTSEFHPNVPEGFEYTWDTDGTDEGKATVYHLAEGYYDGSTLNLTEKWYWFHGNDNYADDCIDEFVFVGEPSNMHWNGSHPCSECEDEFSGTYMENEDNPNRCSYYYGKILIDESADQNNFDAIFYMDTLGATGVPNDNNKTLVISLFENSDGYTWDADYARGHAYPDAEYGGPTQYDWVNTTPLEIGFSK